jgi:hypothetical protein
MIDWPGKEKRFLSARLEQDRKFSRRSRLLERPAGFYFVLKEEKTHLQNNVDYPRNL